MELNNELAIEGNSAHGTLSGETRPLAWFRKVEVGKLPLSGLYKPRTRGLGISNNYGWHLYFPIVSRKHHPGQMSK